MVNGCIDAAYRQLTLVVSYWIATVLVMLLPWMHVVRLQTLTLNGETSFDGDAVVLFGDLSFLPMRIFDLTELYDDGSKALSGIGNDKFWSSSTNPVDRPASR